MSALRLKNWPRLLDAFIESRRHTPFAWGSNDCCLFAADATQAITGIDPAAALRGYRTALGAARLSVAARTEDDPFGVRALPARCGFTEIPVKRASRGDLVVLPMRGLPVVGVCLGIKSVGPGRDGVVFVNTSDALSAWRF